MNTFPNEASGHLPRRTLLTTAAALALAQVALPAIAAGAGRVSNTGPKRRGQPGDFDFLTGEWRIRHRRLVDGQWDRFDGEATCWSLLGGVLHVEELRIPERDFSGSGIRALDLGRGLWCDHWLNGKAGVVNPPSTGSFDAEGAGIFESLEEEQGQPIIVRGVWDRIERGRSHRWHQAISRDEGQTWEMNWEMFWVRAA